MGNIAPSYAFGAFGGLGSFSFGNIYSLHRGVSINGTPFAPIPGTKNKISGPLMNAKVEKKINGLSVSASPIFKGGVLPAYWTCSINDHMIPKIFKSAKEVFRFVKNFKRY